GPLDAPQRQDLWPHLAVLNRALGHSTEATVCWVNALWEETALAPRWARAWAAGECLGADEDIGGEDLDRFLDHASPGSAGLRGLASFLVWAAYNAPPPDLRPRLGRVARFLEAHEGLLPVRGVWLAWASLMKLSQGDVLALARARDRVLERLFKN